MNGTRLFHIHINKSFYFKWIIYLQIYHKFFFLKFVMYRYAAFFVSYIYMDEINKSNFYEEYT